MRTRSKQVVAAVLAFAAADVGVWAATAPQSFYRSFPLPGHHWVSALGPYNEHLTRDVGGLYLALLVISVWAVLRPQTETLRLTGAGWLAFSIPHFTFHMFHLDMYGTADKVGNIVTLGGTLILAALLLLPTHSSRRHGHVTSERAVASSAGSRENEVGEVKS
jgi:hypothetical protein